MLIPMALERGHVDVKVTDMFGHKVYIYIEYLAYLRIHLNILLLQAFPNNLFYQNRMNTSTHRYC